MSRTLRPPPKLARRSNGATVAASLLLAWATGTAMAQTAAAPFAWTVTYSRGEASVQAGGAARPLDAGSALASGSVLRTGAGGQIQLQGNDGSLLQLPPNTELRWPAEGTTLGERSLQLRQGGLLLSSGAAGAWQLQGPAAGNSRAPLLRAAGYLRLQDCRAALGCAAPAGLYGRSALGEAVAEFSGGRSVLRNRSFRWADASQRPEVLARTPALLEDLGLQAAAQAARAAAAEQIKQGLDAFKDNRYDAAESLLRKAQAAAPGEAILSYYLGLIALRREDTANALALLQQYSRDDPAGAAERELPKTLTLLSSNQLQQEVSAAVAREREIASTPPEPGSIAVQAFVSRAGGTPSAEASRDAYAAMAKGLAAMIIADLSKVPGLKVLEREKVQLLVDEARLGSSGIADPRSAVRTGQLLRAEKVIVGNFEVQ
ncbi:MAG: hypothetical protein LW768_05505 [Rubrivivax sp.]|jgi:hypothetical protein|nr:hypothetical protein [Rubrivivax sp.]